jgi:hypothetical protein
MLPPRTNINQIFLVFPDKNFQIQFNTFFLKTKQFKPNKFKSVHIFIDNPSKSRTLISYSLKFPTTYYYYQTSPFDVSQLYY